MKAHQWLPVLVLGIPVCVHAADRSSGWTPSLLSDEAPAQKPWEDGATLTFKSVDGKTTAVADAVLKAERLTYSRTATGWSRISIGPGVYLHRNTDSSKPTNDRGVLFSGGGLWIDDGAADGARKSWGWSVEGKAGRKLTVETKDGKSSQFDKNSARLVGGGQYVYASAIKRSLDPSNLRPDMFWFVTATAKLYVDRVSGGSGASGRIAGSEIGGRVDLAPLGLNPAMTKVGGTGLGFVPSIGIWVQGQDDFSVSGGRTKGSRFLYGVKLQLSFAQLDSDGPIPAVVLERSLGEDVLIGRPDSAVTKLALSLKF